MTAEQAIRRDFYVYAYYRDGVPIYIGKGCGRRWARHVNSTSHNPHLHRMVLKDTREQSGRITCSKIADGLTEAEAFATEVEMIARHGRKPRGSLVNMTDGGDGASGAVRSPETLRRMSEALTGRALSAETKRKLSEAGKGKCASAATRAKLSAAGLGKNKGRRHTEEARAKMSDVKRGKPLNDVVHQSALRANLGRKVTEEVRQKMIAAQRSRVLPEEAKANIAKAHKGVKRSEESRAKMSAARNLSEKAQLALAALHVWRKGRPHSAEARANMGASRVGKKHKPEHTAKRRASFMKTMAARRELKEMQLGLSETTVER